ncbi:hypothetical protein RHMOL_Rhmol10G0206300 [Rhododendron molle]|uniref:Uncharacterized protein n=1 Tax=Rhododendron molle TaxID=49168 RepID=A0ACC0M4L2_RHOML|nr:hypothetical protein RHMOL_Rhmol10G0206300 [Rhododendron molle]
MRATASDEDDDGHRRATTLFQHSPNFQSTHLSPRRRRRATRTMTDTGERRLYSSTVRISSQHTYRHVGESLPLYQLHRDDFIDKMFVLNDYTRLLTMEDAYYEEQMGVFVDNVLLRVHMLGNGAVGQAAFNKKHRDDNSDIHCQFSSGIETIAVISVEPHGVAQFGSINKVFGPSAQQSDLYDQAVDLIVNEVLEDSNCTISSGGEAEKMVASHGRWDLLHTNPPSLEISHVITGINEIGLPC